MTAMTGQCGDYAGAYRLLDLSGWQEDVVLLIITVEFDN